MTGHRHLAASRLATARSTEQLVTNVDRSSHSLVMASSNSATFCAIRACNCAASTFSPSSSSCNASSFCLELFVVMRVCPARHRHSGRGSGSSPAPRSPCARRPCRSPGTSRYCPSGNASAMRGPLPASVSTLSPRQSRTMLPRNSMWSGRRCGAPGHLPEEMPRIDEQHLVAARPLRLALVEEPQGAPAG